MPRELKSNNKKCDGCGGNLKFDPDSQKLTCEKCGKKIDFAKQGGLRKRAIGELSNTQNNLQEWQTQNKVLKCANCGASIVLNSLEYASNCPYCGSSMISLSEELPGIVPDAIIPFAFSEKVASEQFLKGIKNKWFLPRSFKKNLPTSKIRGIYIPAFTFDAISQSQYDGLLSKNYTVTRNGKRETRTRHFYIRGAKVLAHKDVMVETSSKINQKELEQLLPFDHRFTYKFNNDFIRGYVVEHYNDETKGCHLQAKSIFEKQIRKEILKKECYDRVDYLNVNTVYSDEKFLYKVCPIYSFEYRYKKKEFITLMNGQTGKIGGNIPRSKVKITFLVLGIILFVLFLTVIVPLLSTGIVFGTNLT